MQMPLTRSDMDHTVLPANTDPEKEI